MDTLQCKRIKKDSTRTMFWAKTILSKSTYAGKPPKTLTARFELSNIDVIGYTTWLQFKFFSTFTQNKIVFQVTVIKELLYEQDP